MDASNDALFSRCALLVLRGLIAPQRVPHDYVQLLPEMHTVDGFAALRRLECLPKPVACVAMISSGLLTIGTWILDSQPHAEMDDWYAAQREVVFERHPGPSGEPTIFLRGNGEVMRLGFNQLLEFQHGYRFPLAGKGLRRVSSDRKGRELQAKYGADATDSVFEYSPLAPDSSIDGKPLP